MATSANNRLLAIGNEALAELVDLAGGAAATWQAVETQGIDALARHYDAVGVLEPPAGGLDPVGNLVRACARAAKTVVLAGPAADGPATFDDLASICAAHDVGLLGLCLSAFSPAGRAMIAAAQQQTAGEPVYLRYATEVGGPVAALPWTLAGAAALAAQALGAPESIYVTGVRDQGGTLVHLAAHVRHANGGVALLGIGAARGEGRTGSDTSLRRRPASTLFLGNRGAVEQNLVAGGVLTRDGPGGPNESRFERLRRDDVRQPALVGWLAAAAGLARGEGRERGASTARLLSAVVTAARRSLVGGRPERIVLSLGSGTGAASCG